ncbi:hypothetical protein PAXINDRAFT_104614 [Paxillus involutus ATCC 200175]|nr:hypothetical protein PAXINDRAFT_104614 [Paxillus involutus ATCC 200175]
MLERSVGRPWSAQEDDLLANAVVLHGEVDNWKAVALSVPGRTNKACRKRWLHSLSPNVKKTAWTKEEDNLLLELYGVHPAKWAVIARNIPGRTDDACSKRYREALDPTLKKDEWTPEEDEKLIQAYKRLGGRWGQVGLELQRSGLGCRNRWRLLERKRMTVPLSEPQGATSSTVTSNAPTVQLGPFPSPTSAWPTVSMAEPPTYWGDRMSQDDAAPSATLPAPHLRHVRSHNGEKSLGEPSAAMRQTQSVAQVNFPAPFHYSSSSLSSALSSPHLHALLYEKGTPATPSIELQSQIAPTVSVPPDNISSAALPHFDYGSTSSSHTNPSSSTSPATQAADYTRDMHQNVMYEDCQFDQLQRSVPHAAIPIHTPSPHPVRVDHYSATVRHEERSLSHTALVNRRQSAPQSDSFRAGGSAGPYFAPSQMAEQQGSHVSSSMSPALVGSVLDRSDGYYRISPQPQLDVSVQHALLPPDPLSLSEPRAGYHNAHQHDAPRTRVVETTHGKEHRGEYYHAHVLPAQRHVHPLSRPPTTAPPETHYLPQRSATTTPHLEPGPAHNTLDQYYTSTSVQSSQFVHRTPTVPKVMGTPYATRPLSLDGSSADVDDPNSSTFRILSRQRARSTLPRKRPDAQAPLRLSSDLQATPDPSVKPYACGHESCWPTNAASSSARYCTSRGLSDHNKIVHPDDSGGNRPYRCGLEGCGKSWKSINGLQYHLQISKAHFQHAITSTYVVSYIGGLSVPASMEASTSTEGEDKARKQYQCPHQHCPNRYKQLSGLRYHLAHGHPAELPKQLDLVPPALSRKLAEKMRYQGPALPPCEHQRSNSGPAASPRPP